MAAAAVRLRLSKQARGELGAAELEATAHAAMRSQGVLNPSAFAATLLPGPR